MQYRVSTYGTQPSIVLQIKGENGCPKGKGRINQSLLFSSKWDLLVPKQFEKSGNVSFITCVSLLFKKKYTFPQFLVLKYWINVTRSDTHVRMNYHKVRVDGLHHQNPRRNENPEQG